ncbi:hypothetical protein B0H17DRAFT_1046752 [Mycena rosella]|uniref:TLC domain-containing protein n=1 Tax=Mycena rosella TaxID=1033263 RepID=A0AAD7GPB9_MYCRO|nr:hypothetical protein B0H17DRAFT_1046752 [Mycena rosella]
MRPESTSNALVAAGAAILLYYVLQKRYSTQRQRSWIITALSSAIMTLCSAPFVLDVFLSCGDVAAIRPRLALAALACRAFQGCLLADLIVGCRYYRCHVTICWGWIHHSAYILLLHYVVRRGWAHAFCVCAVMELPTLHLALSFLHPRVRHDWLFCASFLATRIVFHVFIFLAFWAPPGNFVVGGSRFPAVFLALAFPGHVVWFAQSVRGAIRRNQKSGHVRQPDRTAFLDQTLVSATLASLDDSTPLWKRTHGGRVLLGSPT